MSFFGTCSGLERAGFGTSGVPPSRPPELPAKIIRNIGAVQLFPLHLRLRSVILARDEPWEHPQQLHRWRKASHPSVQQPPGPSLRRQSRALPASVRVSRRGVFLVPRPHFCLRLEKSLMDSILPLSPACLRSRPRARQRWPRRPGRVSLLLATRRASQGVLRFIWGTREPSTFLRGS